MTLLSTPHLRAIALLALIFSGLASNASGQATYPNRTITLVLPFAAGSGTDTTTRIISQHLAAALEPLLAAIKYQEAVKAASGLRSGLVLDGVAPAA